MRPAGPRQATARLPTHTRPGPICIRVTTKSAIKAATNALRNACQLVRKVGDAARNSAGKIRVTVENPICFLGAHAARLTLQMSENPIDDSGIGDDGDNLHLCAPRHREEDPPRKSSG